MNTELVCLMGIGGGQKDIENAPNELSRTRLPTKSDTNPPSADFFGPTVAETDVAQRFLSLLGLC